MKDAIPAIFETVFYVGLYRINSRGFLPHLGSLIAPLGSLISSLGLRSRFDALIPTNITVLWVLNKSLTLRCPKH